MANNILATGVARFNSGNNTSFLNFEYNSVIVGENAGKSLNISSGSINRNYYNTFIGHSSGTNSSVTLENTFIGFESGTNIQYGSNNILVGKSFDNKRLRKLYDATSVGLNNRPSDASLIFGNSNLDFGNGYENIFVGVKNISHNSLRLTNIGMNNITSNLQDSIIVGNYNTLIPESVAKDVVIIGNNNIFSNIDSDDLWSSSPIFIGNSLYESSNYTLNIDDSFLKYDNYNNREIIHIGAGGKYFYGCNIPVTFGTTLSELYDLDDMIENSSNSHAIYVKSGIYTDSISIGTYDNISNFNISLSVSSNLSSNIEYILPDYPIVANQVLSTNENGQLFWKEVDINNNTTDQLPEGTSNMYYNQSFVDARVNATFYEKFEQEFTYKMSQIDTDNIVIGTSNKFIENGIFNSDMYVFGTLTVNRLRVLGVDIKNDFGINDYINDIVNTSIGDLDQRIDQLSDTLTEYVEILSSTPLNDIVKNYIDDTIYNETNPLKNIALYNDVSTTSRLNINNISYKNDLNSRNKIRIFDVSIQNGDTDDLEYSISIVITYNSSNVFLSIRCHKYFVKDHATNTIAILGNIVTLNDVIITITLNDIYINNENNKMVSILSH